MGGLRFSIQTSGDTISFKYESNIKQIFSYLPILSHPPNGFLRDVHTTYTENGNDSSVWRDLRKRKVYTFSVNVFVSTPIINC